MRIVCDAAVKQAPGAGPAGRIFRDFFHALVVLMKEYQVTTIYNHENPELLGMSSMMGDFTISSLMDNIILLNWVELGDTLRLGINVAKLRANPTPRVTRECEVVDGAGMRILPRAVPTAYAHLPFAAYRGLISRAPTRHATENPEEVEEE